MSEKKSKKTLSIGGAILLIIVLYFLGKETGGKTLTSWQYYTIDQHGSLVESLQDVNQVFQEMGYNNTFLDDSTTQMEWDNFNSREEGDMRSYAVKAIVTMNENQLEMTLEHYGNFGFTNEERIDSTFAEFSGRYQQLGN